MRTDFRGDAPLPEQVANLIREEIAGGRFAPGTTLPGDRIFADAYGVALDTVREALRELRHQGLVSWRDGATHVRVTNEHHPIILRPGDEAVARMPTPAERRDLDLDDGVPVIEIRSAGRVLVVHAASEVALQAG
jgi:DNA-binding FadR family transcriptional regulator